MESLLRDLKLAARSLLRTPSFTFIAILTIGLGIGASTAIFSVVNAVLLRALPYDNADRLVLLWGDLRARDLFDFPTPPADFHDLREQGTLFEEVGAVFTFRQTLRDDDAEPERIRIAGVTHNFLSMLGMRMAAGRDFQPADATPQTPPPEGTPPEAAPPPPPAMLILSHGFWQRRYGGDPSVIGRVIEMGNQRAEIIGVLQPGAELLFPPGTNIERNPDVWVAMRQDFAGGSRINVFLRVIGRLGPGVTIGAAQAQVDGIVAELRRQFPIKEAADLHWRLEPMHEDLVADVRPAIVALMGAVLFVLLIACANVANLLLVRATTRERELAVRSALGGSRSRLVGQLFIESMVLALSGAALGLLLARVGIAALVRLRPEDLPRMDAVSIDPIVLGFTALAAMSAALLFGIVPALRASRVDISEILRESTRTAGQRHGRGLRHGVVVLEVALSFVLLIGCGLMLRSFAALQRTDPGYDPDGLLTFVVTGRGNQDERAAFMRTMRERLGAIPSVEAVTAASPLPLDGGIGNARWGPEAAAADPSLFQQSQVHFVLPGYFDAMRTPLIAGRTFTEEDNVPASLNVVIDDVLARKAFGDERAAVGKRLLIRVRSNEPELFEVIGVVRQQRHTTLAAEGRETTFFTDGQLGHGNAIRWAVRTSGDPLALTSAVRAAVAEVDPLTPVGEVQPMSALVDRARAPTRFALALIAVFAAVAALLAAVGLYGVLSTMVRQRTPEIGVRMAFGAPRSSIFSNVIGQGLRLSVLGVGIGLLTALGATRIMSTMLVGVEPTDPLTFAVTAIVFLLIAALAAWRPAHRAAGLDPVNALREE